MHKIYKFKAVPLTNIHIGTGEELEPINYFIKNNVFFRYSPFKIISNLSSELKNKFINLTETTNIKQIADFLYSNLTEDSIIYKTSVSEIIQREFDEKFTSTENQQIVLEIYRDKSDYLPIIPGSAIKGAIRTAVLYFLMNDKNLTGKINAIAREISKTKKRKERNNLEQKAQKVILEHDNPKNDPFRVLEISDCKIRGKNIDAVIKVKNYHLKKQKFNEFVPSCEAIRGRILNGDGIGEFEINIFSELFKVKNEISTRKGLWKPFKEKLDIKTILKACREFYKNNFLKDLKRLQKFSSSSLFQRLIDEFRALQKNECIIRIGRYSQIENMTIVDHYTKSRMLDENNLPLGYLKLILER